MQNHTHGLNFFMQKTATLIQRGSRENGKLIIRILAPHEDCLTDLKPLVLLPSKARSTVHVLDKQCARFIRVKMNSAAARAKSTSPSFNVKWTMSFILWQIQLKKIRNNILRYFLYFWKKEKETEMKRCH